MKKFSFRESKNNIIRIKGLNASAVINKISEANATPFDKENNNSAQYVASLLKASYGDETFSFDSSNKTTEDTIKLAKELKSRVKGE